MSGIAPAVLDGAALLVSGAGLLVAVAVAAVAGIRAGIPVLLDFLLAAGLLRLAVAPGPSQLVTTALVLVVRHVVVVGLAAGATTARPAGGRRSRWRRRSRRERAVRAG